MADTTMTAEESDEIYFNFINQKTFDGATTEYRLAQKGLNNLYPDEVASAEQLLLQQRNRDTIKNNPESATALHNHRHNMNALKVEWKIGSKGKLKRYAEMQDLWDEFAANPSLDGFGDLNNLQDGWNTSVYMDGEALSREIVIKRKDIIVPLAVQNIPSSYLDPAYRGNDPYKTRNGITFENNAPAIYHFDQNIEAVDFRYRNPSGIRYNSAHFQKIDVPADEVIHIFDRIYGPGQWRGIPMGSAGLLNTYGLDDLIDALNQRQISAQAIHWLVTRQANAPGAASTTGKKITFTDKDTKKEKVIFKNTGGSTQYTNPGEMVTQFQGASLGAEVVDLIKLLQRRKARASGTTYEKMTGDLSSVNMSSLQQLELDLKTYAEFWYEFILIPRGLRPLCNKFQEFAVLYGKSKLQKAIPTFIYPKRYSVNSLKDLQASLLGLQIGTRLYTEELAQEGYTPEEVESDRELQKQIFGTAFEAPKPNQSIGQVGNTQSNTNSKSR